MRRVLVILCAFLLLAGCAEKKKTTRDFFAMDTVMSVTVYGSGAEDALREAVSLVGEMEEELSVTRPESAVARLNSGGSAEFSAEALSLLERTLALSERTGGSLSPKLYGLTSLWGFTTGQYRVPEDSELRAALDAAASGTLTVSGSTVTAEGALLDFGAVAKGEAGDRICAALRARGVKAAVLSLGGNVQTLGRKPDGTAWKIAIRDPRNESAYLGTLETGEGAVVTSGGYQRYFERDGTRYIHILDPATGCPADSGLISVTIAAESGFYADGLSTALYVMGLERACEFWREAGDFEAVLVDESGAVYVTEGLSGSFSGTEFQVITR